VILFKKIGGVVVKKIQSILLMISISLISLAGFAANASWESKIQITPKIITEGVEVELKATIKVVGELKNLKIIAGVDDKIILDYILYQTFKDNKYPIIIKWKTSGVGTHKGHFKVLTSDPSTPQETNTSDNYIETQFLVRPALQDPNNYGGAYQLPGPPNNIQSNPPKINLQFKPCTQNQDQPTDLKVLSFSLSQSSNNLWKYTAKVQNLGKRCLKSFEYKVTNLGSMLVERSYGSEASPNFILGEDGIVNVTDTFSHPGNFAFYPEGNNKMTGFEFTIDHRNLVPDPDRSNNVKEIKMLMNW
jgi:hypothetical protein